jgi:nuclear GTP-binding protein
MDSAARIILRDWAHNTFPYYSTPRKSSKDVKEVGSENAAEGGRVDMKSVLDACKGRKEMRAVGRGLVRFKGGEIDVREVSSCLHTTTSCC